MSESEWVREATEATFQKEVIERSHQGPVLVDFWAGWCAPCKVLGPVLEAAVSARAGEAFLVKVNVEESQGLAARYGVQGIPVVKAFVEGEVRDEFVGARDRASIDAFIDGLIPSPEEEALTRAEVLLKDARPGEVEAVLAPALESPTSTDRALLLLARAAAAEGQMDRAEAALAKIAEASPEAEKAHGLRLQLDLVAAASRAGVAELRRQVEQDPEVLDVRWSLAGALLADESFEEALEQLLEILKRSRSFREDGARRAMLAIFDQIGINHELSNEFRRQMQIYL